LPRRFAPTYHRPVSKNRLEAFSDGVLAIIITIMVLEMKVPHGSDLAALRPVLPVFLSYVLSFVYLGIYWNNHHHLLKAAHRVNAGIMWANLHLLFWLSLLPFVTGWMGENHFARTPTAFYGAVLLLAAIAYYVLQSLIVADQGRDSRLAASIGRDAKGKLSPLFYAAAILATLFHPWIAQGIYVFVALLWLVPDPRLARVLEVLDEGPGA
jgi:TMEM175 potassium channel family protein